MNYSNLTRLPKMSIHPDVWALCFVFKKNMFFLFEQTCTLDIPHKFVTSFTSCFTRCISAEGWDSWFFPTKLEWTAILRMSGVLTRPWIQKNCYATKEQSNNDEWKEGFAYYLLANQGASTKQIIQICLLVAYRKVSHCVLQWYVNIVFYCQKKHHWFAEKHHSHPLPVRNVATHLVDQQNLRTSNVKQQRFDSFGGSLWLRCQPFGSQRAGGGGVFFRMVNGKVSQSFFGGPEMEPIWGGGIKQ